MIPVLLVAVLLAPAPAQTHASAAMIAAPVSPREPATMPILPKSPL